MMTPTSILIDDVDKEKKVLDVIVDPTGNVERARCGTEIASVNGRIQ
jgi:hypothetical protein